MISDPRGGKLFSDVVKNRVGYVVVPAALLGFATVRLIIDPLMDVMAPCGRLGIRTSLCVQDRIGLFVVLLSMAAFCGYATLSLLRPRLRTLRDRCSLRDCELEQAFMHMAGLAAACYSLWHLLEVNPSPMWWGYPTMLLVLTISCFYVATWLFQEVLGRVGSRIWDAD